ncbi:MAG: LysM peptidoglycan-binding domain-containing protein, partial [Actinomycetia bacterium]|nr:LysM peptidoglycan-binding domain-containing protein [Actinomycetes bacterium]
MSTAVTVMLAGLSALITLWLGTLAQFSSERVAAPASGPLPLGVVEVQLGETLEQLAGRVAPDAPVGQIAEQ